MSLSPREPSPLRITGASKRFGASMVLDGIDLDVAPGALVTLLGPSGCGKTTLLRLIAGLAAPDSGRIAIAGRDVTRVPPHKRNVGVVFQSYALFPHLTVRGNVAFGLTVRGMERAVIAAKVDRALSLVQLGALGDRPVAALSGGQQQRVALARALAVEPDVLLFDEALSALDRNLREAMQVELRRLLKAIGTTAIFVTHDQDEALTMSDSVAVMNRGRIEQLADPISLYARPETLFTMRFVGTSAEWRGTVASQAGDEVRVETPSGPVRARGSSPTGTAVVVATRPEHIRITPHSIAPTDDGLNHAEGTIRQVAFHGSRTRVAVMQAEGAEVMVETSGTNGLPEAGAPVRLVWSPAQSFAFVEGERSR